MPAMRVYWDADCSNPGRLVQQVANVLVHASELCASRGIELRRCDGAEATFEFVIGGSSPLDSAISFNDGITFRDYDILSPTEDAKEEPTELAITLDVDEPPDGRGCARIWTMSGHLREQVVPPASPSTPEFHARLAEAILDFLGRTMPSIQESPIAPTTLSQVSAQLDTWIASHGSDRTRDVSYLSRDLAREIGDDVSRWCTLVDAILGEAHLPIAEWSEAGSRLVAADAAAYSGHPQSGTLLALSIAFGDRISMEWESRVTDLRDRLVQEAILPPDASELSPRAFLWRPGVRADLAADPDAGGALAEFDALRRAAPPGPILAGGFVGTAIEWAGASVIGNFAWWLVTQLRAKGLSERASRLTPEEAEAFAVMALEARFREPGQLVLIRHGQRQAWVRVGHRRWAPVVEWTHVMVGPTAEYTVVLRSEPASELPSVVEITASWSPEDRYRSLTT